jgi:hypothetical protein
MKRDRIIVRRFDHAYQKLSPRADARMKNNGRRVKQAGSCGGN